MTKYLKKYSYKFIFISQTTKLKIREVYSFKRELKTKKNCKPDRSEKEKASLEKVQCGYLPFFIFYTKTKFLEFFSLGYILSTS